MDELRSASPRESRSRIPRPGSQRRHSATDHRSSRWQSANRPCARGHADFEFGTIQHEVDLRAERRALVAVSVRSIARNPGQLPSRRSPVRSGCPPPAWTASFVASPEIRFGFQYRPASMARFRRAVSATCRGRRYQAGRRMTCAGAANRSTPNSCTEIGMVPNVWAASQRNQAGESPAVHPTAEPAESFR